MLLVRCWAVAEPLLTCCSRVEKRCWLNVDNIKSNRLGWRGWVEALKVILNFEVGIATSPTNDGFSLCSNYYYYFLTHQLIPRVFRQDSRYAISLFASFIFPLDVGQFLSKTIIHRTKSVFSMYHRYIRYNLPIASFNVLWFTTRSAFLKRDVLKKYSYIFATMSTSRFVV